MDRYIVEGSYPIRGRIRASGNKNAALPCIAATLLTEETVVLKNVPDIEDVHVMLEILRQLGATVERTAAHGEWKITTHDIRSSEVPLEMAKRIRASILLAGPLLARTGRVQLPPPGGDVIGRRRLDTHFLALSALGAQVEIDGVFNLTANKLVGVEIFLDEASVTATENAIMASVLAEGRTVIQNAASEPHVQDLCRMLNAMGAKITGIGSNILTINGVAKLGGAEFKIGSDFMEVGSFIGLAAVTRGELIIEDAAPQNLKMVRLAFGKLGIHWERDGDDIRVAAGQTL
ncbi:MAG: UDP-N-acetylglucosamine 1-carboxyvinyltransferase, partial [Spirochaetota bacterium]